MLEELTFPELDNSRSTEEEGNHHGPEEHEPLNFRKEAIPEFLSGLLAFPHFSV